MLTLGLLTGATGDNLYAAVCHVCTKSFDMRDHEANNVEGLNMCSLDCIQCFFTECSEAYEWGGEPGLLIPLGIRRYQCHHCDVWLELCGADAVAFEEHDNACNDCYEKAW